MTHLKFVVPENISVMAKARDFKFCTLIDLVKWLMPWDEKLSFKWVWSWSF